MREARLSPTDLARARAHLETLGYRIQTEQRQWWECRVSSADEDWHARGDDADDAFSRALCQLFPSRAARLALARALAGVEMDVRTVERPARAPAADDDATRLDLELLDATTIELHIPSESDDTRPPTTAVELVRELERLRARVLGAGPTLAGLPSAVQRLHIIRAAAVTRALAEHAPASAEIQHAADAVIGMLRRMAESFKAGEIRTLAHAVRPNDCAADLDLPAAPKSWRDLATLATQAISRAAPA
jgi:hypothetical protein